ncbi:iron-sulfur cluster assembly protein [Nitratiruptor sp. SB155-2]|uniref:iron-sulfur cluster assembly protein n=1 Tax=Nitratiruptor sp. (strain SB155-2) TaxID=387092 RepID=UPI0001587300|nr:iron-sulfur cluster assembly protein [Nitratiruptor sp. SB155-2]BAF70129.1 metal-sulfur cluster biosynthetic enzyme [Nitratiruptor sp. SB155-2]
MNLEEKEIEVDNDGIEDIEDHEKKYGKPEEIKQEIIKYLKTIYDPEIPVNIYDLGLIYDLKLKRRPDGYEAIITMTLTSVVCPVGESIVEMVKNIANKIDGVAEVDVKLTFDPPWDKSKMSDEAKLVLGMM